MWTNLQQHYENNYETKRNQSNYFTVNLLLVSDGFNVRGAWSEISRGAAVKHFVVAALWYFFRGAALTFFVGAT